MSPVVHSPRFNNELPAVQMESICRSIMDLATSSQATKSSSSSSPTGTTSLSPTASTAPSPSSFFSSSSSFSFNTDTVSVLKGGVSDPPAAGCVNAVVAKILPYHTVLRRLRQTLYGDTLFCEDARTNTNVVLKRLNLQALRENIMGGHENPAEEHRVIQLLQRHGGHRHIVHYAPLQNKGMFVYHGDLYIAMEFCEGGDLFDHLEQQPDNCLPEREALLFVHQVAQAVAFLHWHNVAHRDLSLENILLQNGSAKLCDFGLSCDATAVCNETVGKLCYMAPEVAKGQDYDPRAADVWSLGVVLFVLVTGSPLVADEKTRDKMLSVVSKFGVSKVLELWRMSNRVGHGTRRLLDSMLQVDPSQRPSMVEVVRDPAFLGQV